MTMDLALAIELEGSSGAVGLVDRAGRVVDTEPLATERPSLDAVLSAVDALRPRLERLEATVSVGGVCVEDPADVVPGSRTDDDALARVRQVLGDELGLDVFVDTVGRGLTLAEGWLGSAKGLQNFAAVSVGATVTGGVVLDGRLLDGLCGRAGQIGHVLVEPDGRRCSCGARGCLAAEVSIPAIEATTGRPLSEPTYDQMRHVGQLVGRAAGALANLLDLKVVICGGRVVREYASTMLLAAQEQMDADCRLAFSRGARLLSAKAPEPAGVVGAAAIAWRGLARSH
jgi:glucokinase